MRVPTSPRARLLVVLASLAVVLGLASAARPSAAAAGAPDLIARAQGSQDGSRARVSVRVWHGDGRAWRGVRVTLVVRQEGGRARRPCGRTGAAGRARCSVTSTARPRVFVRPRGQARVEVRLWRYRR